VDTMFADRPTSEDHTAKASSQDTLETVAKQVEARIAASDRDQRRADDHLKSAGLLLIELKKRLKIEQPGMSWPKWSTIHLSISVSRQYVLIAIAEGKRPQPRLNGRRTPRPIRNTGPGRRKIHHVMERPASPTNRAKRLRTRRLPSNTSGWR
jgi:hypothetical protein